jgi:hypothetical protein
MKKLFIVPSLAALLAGCGGRIVTVDPSTVNIITAVTTAARSFCGLLPTADTVAKIILALALPAGLGPEAIASSVAHALCDTVTPIIQTRQGLRKVERATGRTVVDYGPVIINGKVVPIVVYAQ